MHGMSMYGDRSDCSGYRWQTVPDATVRRWVADIACALEYLEAQGLTHGDLKPANLLLSSDGRVKLADFGSACSSHASVNVRSRCMHADRVDSSLLGPFIRSSGR
jgi:serine/threonine protein kinase